MPSVPPTASPKREALRHALHRFHQYEEQALDELRRTAKDAARKPRGDNDMGPEIRVQACRKTLEDLHTLASYIDLPLNSTADTKPNTSRHHTEKLRSPIADGGPPSPDVLPWWNEQAQVHAERTLREHLHAALKEIREAASFRVRIGSEAHAVNYYNRDGQLPTSHAGKAIAAMATGSPEGVRIDLPALAEFAGKALRNLTWEMVGHDDPSAGNKFEGEY